VFTDYPPDYSLYADCNKPKDLGLIWYSKDRTCFYSILPREEHERFVLVELKRETLKDLRFPNLKSLQKDLIFVMAKNPFNNEELKMFWVEANWVEAYISKKDKNLEILNRLKAKWKNERHEI
jgi:hypothetical protein